MPTQFSSPRGENPPNTVREVVFDTRRAVLVGEDKSEVVGDTVIIVFDTESDSASIFVNDEPVARALPADPDNPAQIEAVYDLADEYVAEITGDDDYDPFEEDDEDEDV